MPGSVKIFVVTNPPCWLGGCSVLLIPFLIVVGILSGTACIDVRICEKCLSVADDRSRIAPCCFFSSRCGKNIISEELEALGDGSRVSSRT